jgi:hypothetical protein
MDAHDPWNILAEQGIHFRPATGYPQGWEYALLMLTATWYGPYVSREEALRAALRHLFALVQSGSISMASANIPTGASNPLATSAEQLKVLRQQLRALYLTNASQGIAIDSELNPQIADLIRQIEQIEQSMAESKEES